MWDVHALVERGAVLGRSRRDGCGEGVLMAQTYSREHSNWVALMAWRFWRFCTSSSKVRCLYAVDAASFRRLRRRCRVPGRRTGRPRLMGARARSTSARRRREGGGRRRSERYTTRAAGRVAARWPSSCRVTRGSPVAAGFFCCKEACICCVVLADAYYLASLASRRQRFDCSFGARGRAADQARRVLPFTRWERGCWSL